MKKQYMSAFYIEIKMGIGEKKEITRNVHNGRLQNYQNQITVIDLRQKRYDMKYV